MNNLGIILKTEPGVANDETYSSVKQEYNQMFYDHKMHNYSDAAHDLGLIDMKDFGPKIYPPDHDETHSLSDNEFPFLKMNDRVVSNPFPTHYPTIGYSPYRQHSLGDHNSHYMNYKEKNMFSQEPFGNTATKLASKIKEEDLYARYDEICYPDPFPEDTLSLSLLWSNESTKANNYRNGGPVDVTSRKLNTKPVINYPGLKFEHEEDDHSFGQDYFQKPENTCVKPTQNLSKLLLKKPEAEVSNHSNGYSQLDSTIESKPPVTLKKSSNGNSKSISKSNITLKREIEDDDDDNDPANKNRSSRGLRVLSLKVKDIVCEKKSTTYKEVAESLIQELSQQIKAKGESSKEEQNVKRRVYDALNVLIAADILKKEGKTVSCDDSIASVGASKRKRMKEEKENLEKEIHDIRKRNRSKIEQLQELVFKSLAIKNLIRRNKENIRRNGNRLPEKSENKENPTYNPKKDELIQFPFLLVLSPAPDNSMNLNMDNSQKNLLIESQNTLNIYGDIDVLLKMKLHYVPKQLFYDNIPKELEKYVPKTYLEALK